jgi:hypothetical protein
MATRVADGLEKKVAPDDVPMQVAPAPRSRATHLWDLFRPMAEPVITVLFVLVLCVFMLGRRDDLRSRLIRLVGTRNVSATTHALDEGARKVTLYLRDQALVNAIFGVLVGLGLYLIGVPYFLLWGTVAALARFVPYLGAIASMLMPAALAFAIFPGWDRALLTVGLYVGMDLVTAYAVEPVLFGYRTGASSIALLVSAFFWAWIWGPMGLALAIPITVSLAVLGRHVPALRFLAVLLGDDPVIGAEVGFYQHLLARDDEGAAEMARARQIEVGRAGVMAEMIVPMLTLAALDRARREISEDDHATVVIGARGILEHLPPPRTPADAALASRVIGVAAHGPDGDLLLEMLALELPAAGGGIEILPSSSSIEEVLLRLDGLAPEVVCIGSFPPADGPHARRLCMGIKARFPAQTVMAFRPGEPGVDPLRAADHLRKAGADVVVATLAEATAELTRLLHRPAASGAATRAEPTAPLT